MDEEKGHGGYSLAQNMAGNMKNLELIPSHSPHEKMPIGLDNPAEPELPHHIGRTRVNSYDNTLKSIPSNMKIDVKTLSGPIRRYYEEQQELIGLLSHQHADDDDDDDNKDKGSKISILIAIRASYASNIILLLVKIYALVISGSLAMLASVLDSCLDILSGSVLFCAQRIVDEHNKYKYPIGKNRAQPIATIIFACLMGMSALQVWNALPSLFQTSSHVFVDIY